MVFKEWIVRHSSNFVLDLFNIFYLVVLTNLSQLISNPYLLYAQFLLSKNIVVCFKVNKNIFNLEFKVIFFYIFIFFL